MSTTENQSTVSTGVPSLDEVLGCGGYPAGRLVEVFGPQASGKTTLALRAVAECQRTGGIAAFVDVEHALDIRYATSLGVSAKSLLVSQPETGEQALEIVETLVRSGVIKLVIVDSVASLVPKAEIGGEMDDQHMGMQARLMSQALRKLTGIAGRTGTTIIFINQLRPKLGVTFGSPETTSSGSAIKYYSSMRLGLRRVGEVKVDAEVVGQRTRVTVVKNNSAPPSVNQFSEFDIQVSA